MERHVEIGTLKGHTDRVESVALSTGDRWWAYRAVAITPFASDDYTKGSREYC